MLFLALDGPWQTSATRFYRWAEGAFGTGSWLPCSSPVPIASWTGAYSSRTVRRYLHRRSIWAVIPTHNNEQRSPTFDRAAYRERNAVERLINRLKQFRRIAARHEKRAANYLTMLTLAVILLWL